MERTSNYSDNYISMTTYVYYHVQMDIQLIMKTKKNVSNVQKNARNANHLKKTIVFFVNMIII